jgi:hypothetical protein
MELVGKSKVTRLNAKTGITYPLIRLPKTFANAIGRTAKMYEGRERGNRTLLITFPESYESREVIQPKSQYDVEKRLSTLESQITELKSLILENTSCLQTICKKEAPESGFEPESEPRQGLTGTSHPLATHPSGCVSP